MSEYDIRAEVNVSSLTPDQQREANESDTASDLLSWAHPETTWLERQAQEDVQDGEGFEAAEAVQEDVELNEGDEAPKFECSIRWDIGGATVLAGASYFWFFTWLMLGTAVLFMPVGYLYKPKTYLQEEGDA